MNEIEFPRLTQEVLALMERKLIARLREYAQFEAERNRWYRHGDGRRVADGGKGYAFPTCIHGASAWTAYDSICGACEAGYGYWNTREEVEDAYYWAINTVKRRKA